MYAFVDEKSQIVFKSTLDECEVFLFKYFEDYIMCVVYIIIKKIVEQLVLVKEYDKKTEITSHWVLRPLKWAWCAMPCTVLYDEPISFKHQACIPPFLRDILELDN